MHNSKYPQGDIEQKVLYKVKGTLCDHDITFHVVSPVEHRLIFSFHIICHRIQERFFNFW